VNCVTDRTPEWAREQIVKEAICPFCGCVMAMRMSSSGIRWLKACGNCGVSYSGGEMNGVRVGQDWRDFPDGVMVVERS